MSELIKKYQKKGVDPLLKFRPSTPTELAYFQRMQTQKQYIKKLQQKNKRLQSDLDKAKHDAAIGATLEAKEKALFKDNMANIRRLLAQNTRLKREVNILAGEERYEIKETKNESN